MNRMHGIRSQLGAVLLMMSLILVMIIGVLSIFAANNALLYSKSVNNLQNSYEAFEAAQAGLENGIYYLQDNISTVIASPSSGFISYALPTVTLSNSSKYTIAYTNPTADDYNTIRITVVGLSSDNLSTRTVTQLVYYQNSAITFSAVARGNATLIGGSHMTNTETDLNLQTGGSVTINNGAATFTSAGRTSSQNNINSDIQENTVALQGISEPTFFQQMTGTSKSSALSMAQASGTYYNNAVSGGDYSQQLNGKEGVVIYIDQATVSIGQGARIGSEDNPVTIIVNGDVTIDNGVRIYGYVYSTGPATGMNLAGGAHITGGVASYGVLNISNGFRLEYADISPIANSSTSAVKISGTWRDF